MSDPAVLRLALAAGVALALSAARAQAQERDAVIEEIIVSSPLHRGQAETVLPVNVVAGEELQRKLRSTLGETLQQEMGLTYASFGPGVGQPVIRGQGAPRVMVLANGMPVGDASNTSQDHANGIEPVLAERIEVLRGPATLLFGSGAIGGVVNVIDSRVPRAVPESLTGAIEHRRASNADARVTAGRLETGSGRLAVHVDGFARENDEVEIPGTADIDGEGDAGEIANSNAEASAGTLGMSWVEDWGFVGASVNHMENEYGIPGGAHGHHSEDGDAAGSGLAEEEFVRIDMEQTRYDARAEVVDPVSGIETLRTQVAYTDYQHKELEGEAIGTTFGNNTLDARIEAVHDIGGWHGAAGLQVASRDFKAVGEEAFVPGSESDSWGLFLIEDLHLDRLTWEFGLRYGYEEHNPEGGAARDFDTFSASVSGLWDVSESQTLKFSLSRSQRAPATEELFSDGVHVATASYEVGDTDLREETSLNLDVGYHYHSESVDLRLDAFLNQYRDYIFKDYTGLSFNPDLEEIEAVCSADDPDECLGVLQWSADDARFLGAEFDLDVALVAGFSVQLFGDIVQGELDRGGNVPRMAPARLGTGLVWTDGPWDLGMRVTKAFEQDEPGINETSTDGYTAVSAHAEYRMDSGPGTWTVFLRGENLLDEDIRNATSVLRDRAPEAGLNIEAGVRLEY
jgi:iron complex outermembrane recepter protein